MRRWAFDLERDYESIYDSSINEQYEVHRDKFQSGGVKLKRRRP